jgi:hypothetical protein
VDGADALGEADGMARLDGVLDECMVAAAAVVAVLVRLELFQAILVHRFQSHRLPDLPGEIGSDEEYLRMRIGSLVGPCTLLH